MVYNAVGERPDHFGQWRWPPNMRVRWNYRLQAWTSERGVYFRFDHKGREWIAYREPKSVRTLAARAALGYELDGVG